ncbi:MAG: hypothetical protein H6876_10610 [Hyphomicrobiaceae bacterium]|nr:hypothetical protein [Hyphomicrobiaceae bacterium]MCC0008554.1 hypothetical protein [Hyphomicrobiaceae bacterium]
MTSQPSRLSAAVVILAAVGMLTPAQAAPRTPQEMMAHCRAHAAKVLKMRQPDVETKYEGQRVDGTHAVNGTGRDASRTVTFQCSFGKNGGKIKRFVVNKPSGKPTEPPTAAAKPTPGKSEAECLAAVSKQIGHGGVSTISVKKGETATQVLVKVQGAQKPWRCDHDGKKVLRVMYMGEG